jgi:hypothetical protein
MLADGFARWPDSKVSRRSFVLVIGSLGPSRTFVLYCAFERT